MTHLHQIAPLKAHRSLAEVGPWVPLLAVRCCDNQGDQTDPA
jgi:hypothetical protein